MEKYLQGRIAAYAHLFTEISPPIPEEHKRRFYVNSVLLPGYTVETPVSDHPDPNAVDDLLSYLDDDDMDEDGIVIGIAVKPGHGAEIVRKFVALKQVLYASLNPGDDFLDPFPVAGLFICHGKKSPFFKMTPHRKPKRPMRGKIPQVEVNFGPPRVKLRPWADWRFENVVPQGFPALYLRKCEAAFAFRSRSRLRRSLAAQAEQYFTELEREKIGAAQIRQLLTGRADMISPCSS